MALGALVGILLLTVVYKDLSDFLEWDVSFLPILEYFFMTALAYLPIAIPVSLLVSLLFILGHFHKNQELTAMRAAGLGIFRITRSLWAAGALLSLLMLALNATLVPYASDRAATILARSELAHKEKTGQFTSERSRGEFLFYNNPKNERNWLITSFSPYTNTGYNVNLYSYKNNRICHAIAAQIGTFDEVKKIWTLRHGREIFYDTETGLPTRQPTFETMKISAESENPRIMALIGRKVSSLSIPEIGAILKEVGDDSTNPRIAAYAVSYNTILASPFCCLVVVGIAIPFAVSGVRKNPMVGVSMSILLFAIYYLLTSLFSALGSAQFLPPLLAAWTPNLLLGVFAFLQCRKVN